MKRLINLSAVLILFSILATTAFAQSNNTNKNQKSFNNNVRMGTGQFTNSPRTNWIDENGDGICDNYGTVNQGKGKGHGYGLKDGSGAGTQPKDGTGFGRKNGMGVGNQNNATGFGKGNGTCDGSGPKGNTGRGGRGRK